MDDPRVAEPIARSPIAPVAPTTVIAGWEVSERRSDADLRLADLTPLAKVHVRAAEDGPLSAALGVGFREALRDEHGVLVIGSGPGEWTLIAPVGTAGEVMDRVTGMQTEERVTVVDVTHGRALVRLTGEASPEVLATLCSIDLDDRVTPDRSGFRSSVAGVVTDVVRNDRGGQRSYLLHCERSSGAYLVAKLVDVGRGHGLDIEGFPAATTDGGDHVRR